MKKRNLRQELFDSGAIESVNLNQIDDIKKQFRKDYLKSFKEDYKQKSVRKTLIFSKDEFSYLSTRAELMKKKLSTYLKEVIFAYENKAYVFPESESIHRIEVLLRDIQNRIAETIMYVHMSEKVSTSDVEKLRGQVKSLEMIMESMLKRPPNLSDFLRTQMKRDPFFHRKLMQELTKYIMIEPNDNFLPKP